MNQLAAASASRNALQSALRAVNAAIYGYGVAGAHLTGSDQAAAQQDWAAHEAARDALAAMLTALGAQPPAAQAAYQMPFPVHNATAAISLAGYLEDQLTTAYLGVVALSSPALRTWGAQQAQACAVRSASWLGRSAAFPGLPAAHPAPGHS